MASRVAHGSQARGESSPSGASPAIEARGLVKRFGERRALDGVDIDLPRGAFLSIFGPNGAGKTTLLRELALLARPTSGSLRMLGVDALVMASRAAHGFPARGESSPSGASPAIEARGLVKRFGERRALDGVDIDLPRGAFLSIFGPNGAGKTTLLRELALLARPTSGGLRMLGVDALEEPDALRPRIGLI